MNRTGEVYRGDQVRILFVQTHTSGVGFTTYFRSASNSAKCNENTKKNQRHYVDTSIEKCDS